MKAGIIDIFADTFGWVLGKAAIFAVAILLGVGIGACALSAGTAVGTGGFGFRGGSHPIHGQLSVVTAILPQIFVIFWAGMAFVRSEKAEGKHWVGVIAMEALAMTGCFAAAMPGGLIPQIAAWSVVIGGIAAVYYAVMLLERRQMRRGMDHLARLEMENSIRREEMKIKYGTTSTSARDLGLL